MTVYRKKRELHTERINYLNMPKEEVIALFDKAIVRYRHSKPACFASPNYDSLTEALEADRLARQIEELHGQSPQDMRYLNAFRKLDDSRKW